MAATLPIRVAALYRFTRLADPAAVRARLADACAAAGVKGTLLVATEGLNGTIAGSAAAIEAALAAVRALPGCADLGVRESRAETMPFHRLKVRLKREIVTMGLPAGVPSLDPASGAGDYVDPADWNALIDAPGTIVIDTRNEYEVAIGSFAGALDPGTRHFSDFPAWFRANRTALFAGAPRPRVAMFCTGGIRCEKATAFLKAEGVEQVHHLKGGILAYLESVPAKESRWRGECFVFDQRVAVGHGLMPGTHSLCHGCRMPVSAAARASPLYREGVSCPACHDLRNDEQRGGYAERHRQTQLAEVRGEAHIGAVFAAPNGPLNRHPRASGDPSPKVASSTRVAIAAAAGAGSPPSRG